MTKSPHIIAYSFNSAICCPACTAEALENGEIIQLLTDHEGKPLTRAVTKFDLHGTHPFTIPEAIFTTNHEPVTPIFNTDDYPDGYTCDTCGEVHP